uniref:Reverse transcriptase Ty1/copia-type domain-containing protein n=1 Tax=Vitis vinifera TaxID=29760 RepID=A5C2Z0_VITVI|nr:hypothetical protein VITISV_036214 [Vitis vinifera]
MYVNDILVTSNDSEKLSKLKTYLAVEFEIKDLGTLRYFLCIEVARLKMLACEPIDTPIKQNHRLGECPNDTPVDKKRYRRLVGKLIHLAHAHLDMAIAALVKELRLGSRDPMELYCDNKAAISITHYLVEHNLTKHIKEGGSSGTKENPGERRRMDFLECERVQPQHFVRYPSISDNILWPLEIRTSLLIPPPKHHSRTRFSKGIHIHAAL